MRIQSIGTVNSINRQQPNFRRNWGEHAGWGALYNSKTGKTGFKMFTFPEGVRSVFVEIADKTVKGLDNIKERIVQVIGAAGFGLVINDVLPADKDSKIFRMENKGDGIYEADGIDAKPDDKYRFIIVKEDNSVNLVKDPYSKKQDSIHGWSSIYNKDNYRWENREWLEGKDPRRIKRNPDDDIYHGLANLRIDEVNIPTLTEEGTFIAAKKEIEQIAKDGIANAVEFMPVENTFSKQWGYDGVDKFAVNEKLGSAAQLKELIDYAHSKGLNVIMDMVPNHMGPDGDYLSQTGPYEAGDGKFGATFNYEFQNNRYVRDWMVNAALWWANEFKVDGLRLDMTKETASDYLLKQIADELNEHNPDVFLIAEDGRENYDNVTKYDKRNLSHKDRIDEIDMFVDFLHSGTIKADSPIMGYDSEWDFPLMHALKKSLLEPNEDHIHKLDSLIGHSNHRVKYALSHDEIGNNDGTRLIPKAIAQYLDLFSNMTGKSDADRGQKAAQLAQKLAEMVVTDEKISNADLGRLENDYGLKHFYSKEVIIDAILASIAKQRLATGTVMTIPGPKMFFQGDEVADLSHFKFFRELSGDKAERENNPNRVNEILDEKGYDTIVDKALPDSKLGRVKPKGVYADIQKQMLKYNQDLVAVINDNPALQDGTVVSTYKDHGNLVHIHKVKKGDNELLILKNFGKTFYDGNYSTLGFPDNEKYVEILNSDDKIYGGGGKTNKEREFTNLNQNLNFASNSIIILKRIG